VSQGVLILETAPNPVIPRGVFLLDGLIHIDLFLFSGVGQAAHEPGGVTARR
jgi:hypothetical protein